MDGVVVDNHRYHFASWMKFAEKYQFELDEDIYREKFNGKTNRDLFCMIFGDLTEKEIESLAEEKESMYQRLYAENIKPHTGLIDFLELLKKKRIKIALGTSAPPMNVDFTLDTLKLRKYFEVIVDGSQVERGKPDPQVYELCCLRLGLLPRDCLVFEDALLGIEAAKRAGCHVIGVATSHKASELEGITEKIIHDFTEVRRLLKL